MEPVSKENDDKPLAYLNQSIAQSAGELSEKTPESETSSEFKERISNIQQFTGSTISGDTDNNQYLSADNPVFGAGFSVIEPTENNQNDNTVGNIDLQVITIFVSYFFSDLNFRYPMKTTIPKNQCT